MTAGRHLVPPQCFHGCGPPGAARGHGGAAVSGTLGAPPFGCRVCGAPSLWGWWLACGVGGSARTAVVLHKLASWLRERAASGGRVFAISGAGPSLLCFAWHGGSHRWLAAVVRLPHLHCVGAVFHSARFVPVCVPPLCCDRAVLIPGFSALGGARRGGFSRHPACVFSWPIGSHEPRAGGAGAGGGQATELSCVRWQLVAGFSSCAFIVFSNTRTTLRRQ